MLSPVESLNGFVPKEGEGNDYQKKMDNALQSGNLLDFIKAFFAMLLGVKENDKGAAVGNDPAAPANEQVTPSNQANGDKAATQPLAEANPMAAIQPPQGFSPAMMPAMTQAIMPMAQQGMMIMPMMIRPDVPTYAEVAADKGKAAKKTEEDRVAAIVSKNGDYLRGVEEHFGLQARNNELERFSRITEAELVLEYRSNTNQRLLALATSGVPGLGEPNNPHLNDPSYNYANVYRAEPHTKLRELQELVNNPGAKLWTGESSTSGVPIVAALQEQREENARRWATIFSCRSKRVG